MGHQLLGDLFRERRLEPTSHVDGRQLLVLAPVVCFELPALELECRPVRCLPVSGRTRTHRQPSTSPPRPGRRPPRPLRCCESHPQLRLPAPDSLSTRCHRSHPIRAARSQPMRPMRCRSLCLTTFLATSFCAGFLPEISCGCSCSAIGGLLFSVSGRRESERGSRRRQRRSAAVRRPTRNRASTTITPCPGGKHLHRVEVQLAQLGHDLDQRGHALDEARRAPRGRPAGAPR